MGTTLTGTTPQDTYDSLIKVTDNGPLSGSLKVLTDGLGNNSTLSLSTTAASIAGTLAVTGNATFDTNTLFVDAANNRVGVGTASPANTLDVAGTGRIKSSVADYLLTIENIKDDSQGLLVRASDNDSVPILKLQSSVGATSETWVDRFVVNKDGNVGIGTSAPTEKLHINSGTGNVQALFQSTDPIALITFDDSDTTFSTLGLGCSGDNIVFYQDTEQMRITSGGVLQLTQGQIKFPATQVASADANTLDDYEEGTFTPTASSGITINTVTKATYTKIGNIVTFQVWLKVDITSASFIIAGLPVTISDRTTCSISNITSTQVITNQLVAANTIYGYGATTGTNIDLFMGGNYRAA